jgi:membrane protein YqaA with SNARE-associated domain
VTTFLAYAGLFMSALLAATILPMQSEAVLSALLASRAYPVAALIAVASLGNILGAMINWFLGRGIERFRGGAWFPLTPPALDRAAAWYHRYGRWSLLASWVPIIGDPLTVIAGVLREPLWSFTLLVGIAKITRYVVLAALVLNWA